MTLVRQRHHLIPSRDIDDQRILGIHLDQRHTWPHLTMEAVSYATFL